MSRMQLIVNSIVCFAIGRKRNCDEEGVFFLFSELWCVFILFSELLALLLHVASLEYSWI